MFEYAYSIKSNEELTELQLEIIAFGLESRCYAQHGIARPPSLGGLGRDGHFWKIAELLWGPKSSKHFIRHPWAEKFIYHAARVKYLGVSGCGQSGKTDAAACWAIVNWLADPENTLVLVTSTSLKDSRKRIWGSVTAYFQAAAVGLPGKLVDSLGMIRTIDQQGNANNDKAGISLIAGEKKKEKETIGKLIGMKNQNVLLIADEFPELSEAILEAAYSNLALNPVFNMIGIGNFASIYDPFGVFVRPKKGYGTITLEDDEWDTEKGYCIRFDGTRSPNILEGRDRKTEYPIYNSRNLKEHRETLGENSARFWRMCRSFPAPLGTEDTIYTEMDLIAGAVSERPTWLSTPTRISALDPSFTNGGDRSMQLICSYGQATNGLWTLCFDEYLPLHDDAGKRVPRDYQIARAFRDNCMKFGVSPENAGLDSTAAGSVLLSIVHEEWSPLVLGINFSGYPTEMLVSASDPVTARDKFDRRVSELWWVGREFVKYGQIKGVNDDLARELKARKYTTQKGPEGLKIKVETKRDMKDRLGFSPDIADTAAVALDIARSRFGALAGGIATGLNRPRLEWEAEISAHQAVFESINYGEQAYESEVAEPSQWG